MSSSSNYALSETSYFVYLLYHSLIGSLAKFLISRERVTSWGQTYSTQQSTIFGAKQNQSVLVQHNNHSSLVSSSSSDASSSSSLSLWPSSSLSTMPSSYDRISLCSILSIMKSWSLGFSFFGCNGSTWSQTVGCNQGNKLSAPIGSIIKLAWRTFFIWQWPSYHQACTNIWYAQLCRTICPCTPNLPLKPSSLSFLLSWAKQCCYAQYLMIAWHRIGARGAHM